MRNNLVLQLRESCRIYTIVNNIVLNQYNAIYDREN